MIRLGFNLLRLQFCAGTDCRHNGKFVDDLLDNRVAEGKIAVKGTGGVNTLSDPVGFVFVNLCRNVSLFFRV